MKKQAPEPILNRMPLYRQVAATIREQYIQGRESGVRLPTERDFAQMLEVSMATVRAALDNLEDVGCIERRVGSGTFTLNAPRIEKRHVAVLLEADIARPDLSPYFLRTLQEVRQALLRQNIPSRPYLGYLCIGKEIGELTCRDFFDDLHENRISGVICIHARKHVSWMSQLSRRSIPVVGANRTADHLVDIDAPDLLHRVFSTLQSRGRKHLMFVCLNSEYLGRLETSAQQMALSYGIQVSLIRLPQAVDRNSLEDFKAAWKSTKERPDSLFLADDMQFHAIQSALDDLDPTHLDAEDCYVVGSDAVSLRITRPFTECKSSTRQRAIKLAEAMQILLSGQKVPRMVPIPVSFLTHHASKRDEISHLASSSQIIAHSQSSDQF